MRKTVENDGLAERRWSFEIPQRFRILGYIGDREPQHITVVCKLYIIMTHVNITQKGRAIPNINIPNSLWRSAEKAMNRHNGLFTGIEQFIRIAIASEVQFWMEKEPVKKRRGRPPNPPRSA